VRLIEPETESDPAAILVQFLAGFGVLVGRGPHVRVEGDEHHGNLFTLLVGETSKGRKGTSLGRVKQILERVNGWPDTASGLSSGEGLKYAVRDPVEKPVRNKTTGETVLEQVDPGVMDKRLLVTESEFAQALRTAARPGNTLSATVREAWDTGRLATITRNDPIRATGAHIAIIGHITADELRAELTATDTANGFANRFLFVAVRRSKCLPFGGATFEDAVIDELAARVERAATLAKTRQVVPMTAAARKVWASVYAKLSEGRDGLLGSATARAEAQCLRLGLLYALLDELPEIDVAHLLAGIAVWEYCDATARFVFGDAIGDRVADDIRRALLRSGDSGMSRTDIRNLFNRHESGERIEHALDMLDKRGQARLERRNTGGRPEDVWFADGATYATYATKGGHP
jgi:hypothetical protein